MHLPTKKLQKARLLVQSNSDKKSVTLLDLQQISGYLNFVAIMVPLGRTFLRRLYNMELYFPSSGRYQQRRLSSEARKDIDWWWEALAGKPERSILTRVRQTISTWSDAASKKGLGGYYTCETHPLPQSDSVFAIVLPNNPTRQREHINTQEMRAVEQVLLYWGRRWRGKRIQIHVDNRAVAYGLAKGTIRGASMRVLRRCLLLATEYDLELEPQWISTRDNGLADALSCWDINRITDLAPQLLQDIYNLPNHGLQIYSSRDSLP